MPFYSRTLRYIFKEYRWVLVLTVLIFALSGLAAISAWPVALLIDYITTSHESGTLAGFQLPSSAMASVSLIIAAFFVIKLLQDALSLCRSMVGLRIKYSVSKCVRRDLFSHMQRLGSVFFKTHAQGDAIFRLTNDTYGPYCVFDTILTSVQAVVSLSLIVSVMFYKNVPLTLFAISLAPILALANWHFGKRIKARTIESRQMDADLLSTLQRALSFLKITQLFSRHEREERVFDQAQAGSIDSALRLNWQENLYPFAVQTLFGLGQAAILAVGTYLVLKKNAGGSSAVTCGDLVLFIAYFNQISEPLSLVFGFSARVKGSVAASERVYSILDQIPTVTECAGATALPLEPRDLLLENVWFSYPGNKSPTLCGLHAEIRAGELVAFVGQSGTGKSTLLELISRFHDPIAGRIVLGDIDLRRVTLASVRQHIAVVSQDYAVMPGTVFDNICYGNPDATRAEVLHAAQRAGVDSFIPSLANGYETQIAEGGQNLSAGQRQRIAIARALLTKASILILDEPTSALDPPHEQMFMRLLQELKGTLTVILVTHRLDTVAACDQIFVMRHGRIFEQGSHLELLEQRGLYAEMQSAAAALSTVESPMTMELDSGASAVQHFQT